MTACAAASSALRSVKSLCCCSVSLLLCCTGHCKRLAPTWAELGAAVKDNPTIKIAHVDCTVDRDVCTNAEVSQLMQAAACIRSFFQVDGQLHPQHLAGSARACLQAAAAGT